MNTLEKLTARLSGVKIQGEKITATCPVCNKEGHLYITPKSDRLLVYCQKCQAHGPEIASAVGLTAKDLYYDGNERKETSVQEREHIYRNPDGSVFAKKVIRKKEDGSKSVCWYRWDEEKKSYLTGLDHQTAPLYRMDKLGKPDERPLFFVEGEKDVETLEKLNQLATTAPNGGGQTKWPPEWDEVVRDKIIIVLTDNDETGEKYGRFIESHCRGKAQEVMVIPAKAIDPEVGKKEDISDIAARREPSKTIHLLSEAVEASRNNREKAPKTDEQKGIIPVPLTQYEAEEPRFLWEPYIQKGEVTILAAPGGSGKGWFQTAVIASVTAGKSLPGMDTPIEPGNILLFSAEETGGLIRNRLAASGADSSRVYVVGADHTGSIDFYARPEEFSTAIEAVKPALVIIDPLQAYIGDADTNKQSVIRPIMQNLAAAAKKFDTSVLLVAHTNKRAQLENANNAVIGSSDIVNAARSAILIRNDDAEPDRRLAIHTKCNHARLGKTVAFRITGTNGKAMVTWDGFSDVTKAVIEEAAANHKKPSEIIRKRTQEEVTAEDLMKILLNLTPQDGQPLHISCEDIKHTYGSDIFTHPNQPNRDIHAVARELQNRGVFVKSETKNNKRGITLQRSFRQTMLGS